MLEESDVDGSGTVSEQEFEQYSQDRRVQAYFSALDLDVTDAKELFKLLDVDASGGVSVNEFVQACMRLRGSAKSMDLQFLMYESKRLKHECHRFHAFVDARFAMLFKALGVDEPAQEYQEKVEHHVCSPVWKPKRLGPVWKPKRLDDVLDNFISCSPPGVAREAAEDRWMAEQVP